MVRIAFVGIDMTRYDVDAAEGRSVMEAARKNNVPGIDAICGGCCACGTCRVEVAAEWYDKLPPPGPIEQEMLEYVTGVGPTARLCCQITVNETLDGLLLNVPEHQG